MVLIIEGFLIIYLKEFLKLRISQDLSRLYTLIFIQVIKTTYLIYRDTTLSRDSRNRFSTLYLVIAYFIAVRVMRIVAVLA